jgi:hypothetical protein
MHNIIAIKNMHHTGNPTPPPRIKPVKQEERNPFKNHFFSRRKTRNEKWGKKHVFF